MIHELGEPHNASKIAETNQRLSNINKNGGKPNQALIKVIVTSPINTTSTIEIYCYTTPKEMQCYVEIIGFELPTNKKLKTQINTYDDVTKLVKNGSVTIKNVKIPWHRIVEIQNLSYIIK